MEQLQIGPEVFYRGQPYRLTVVTPHTRRDGSETLLLTWASHCAECGAPFETQTPGRTAIENLVFTRRCPEHRQKRRRKGASKQPDLCRGIDSAVAVAILDDIDRAVGLPEGERYTSASAAKVRGAFNVVLAHCPHMTEALARESARTWIAGGRLVERDYRSPGQRRARKGLFTVAERRPSIALSVPSPAEVEAFLRH